MGKIRLIPGKSITGDANDRQNGREEILNVKSFYEQDSHIMPEEIVERQVTMEDGSEHVWYEYAPADLKVEENPPLIISLHGGGQDGYGQCYATSWVLLADKYRFVTMFPTGSENRMWNPDPEGPDFPFIHELIQQAKARYGIDEERIFLQGMSMGNMMTTGLCKAESVKYAGAGMAAGPDSTEFISNPDYDISNIAPIPVFQSRGERDRLTPKSVDCAIKNRYDLNKADREFWLRVNGCSFEPDAIRIDGRDNLFLYKGTKANLIFRDVKMRGHGQTLDDAEMVWRYCFSGARRKADGSLAFTEPLEKLESDQAVILADGCSKAYVNSVKLEIGASVYQVREHLEVPEELAKMDSTLKPQDFGPYTYAPVAFLAQVFGYQVEATYQGHGAVLKRMPSEALASDQYVPNSTGKCKAPEKIEIAEGNVACLYDGVLSNMERQAEYKDGILFVPVKDWVERLGKIVIEQDGALYISDHAGEMTKDTANYIKELLK